MTENLPRDEILWLLYQACYLYVEACGSDTPDWRGMNFCKKSCESKSPTGGPLLPKNAILSHSASSFQPFSTSTWLPDFA